MNNPSKIISGVWFVEYDPPIAYEDWHRLARTYRQPPIGAIVCGDIREVPGNGRGPKSVVVFASNNLIRLDESLIQVARSFVGHLIRVEDVFNPGRNVLAEMKLLRDH